MSSFSFDGVDIATIPEVAVTKVTRPLVAARRDSFVDVPGREGFWFFEEAAGGRRITIDVDILGASFAARRAAVIALADLVDRPGLRRLIIADEPDRFHNAHLLTSVDPDEWLNSAEFSLEFMAEPFSLATAITVETRSIAASATSITVPDKVDAYPVVEITAIGGTILGYNLTVGALTLVDTGSIGASASKTVSSLNYLVTAGLNTDTELDGTFIAANISMAGVSGDFPILKPGVNTVTLTRLGGTATSATVRFSWRRRSR